MKILPRNDYVLVRLDKDSEEITEAGVVLPNMGEKQFSEGEVLAVGPGRLMETGQRGSMNLSQGDKVVVLNNFSISLGAGYILTKEDSLVGVIK